MTASPLLAEAVRIALDAASQTGQLMTPTLGRNLRAAGYDENIAHSSARAGDQTFSPAPAGIDAWRQVRLEDDAARPRRDGVGPRRDGQGARGRPSRRMHRARNRQRRPRLARWRHRVRRRGAAPAGGQYGSQTTIARPSTDRDRSSPSPAAASRRPAPPLGAGGRRRASCITLFDPRTGRPARTRWRTVSVAARTASRRTSPPPQPSCSASARAPGSWAGSSRRGLSARTAMSCTSGGWPIAADAA